MTTSIFLARLIGPISLVTGIALFMQADTYKVMALEFIRSPALLYLSGVLAMSLGLALVLTHNVWAADWRVLITILGWLATIGGAIRILAPGTVKSMGENILENRTAMTIGGGIWLAIGAILCFFGYLR